MTAAAGDKEVAQELAGKGKEHAQLAKEARTKANQAAYDSSNMNVANRFKVSMATVWMCIHIPTVSKEALDCSTQLCCSHL